MTYFSVVIPNYNCEKFIRRRIETILNQTYPNIELIILDDNSKDNSNEIIEEYRSHPKVSQIIYNSQNSGSPFKQWKKGIENAKGNWIWIAECDDFADSEFLGIAAGFINKNPSLGLYYCDTYKVDKNDLIIEKFSEKKNSFFNTSKWTYCYYQKGDVEINEYFKLICAINNASSAVFRKEIALDFLHELEEYKYHGDWLFYLRLCSKADIYYYNQPLNFYREHQDSHLSSPRQNIISKQEYFKILYFIYFLPFVSEKKKVLTFFTDYYLSFGFIQEGGKSSFNILASYFKINTPIALKVLLRLCWLKLIRVKHKKFL